MVVFFRNVILPNTMEFVMKHASAPREGNKDGEERASETRRAERPSRLESSSFSFSGEDQPILRKVFRKLCNLSNTLEEIEGWIDDRGKRESLLVVPRQSRQIVLTPENLGFYIAKETQVIVESWEKRFGGDLNAPF